MTTAIAEHDVVLTFIPLPLPSTTTTTTEIKSLSGEPDYKSVNLTWEIEPVDDDGQLDELQPPPPPAFQVYYCEMQSWGPQRCKSKVLNEANTIEEEEQQRNGRQFSLAIDNLRMATKYSFHVRQMAEGAAAAEPKGRRIDPQNTLENGEMIVIPTKGCKKLFKIVFTSLFCFISNYNRLL